MTIQKQDVVPVIEMTGDKFEACLDRARRHQDHLIAQHIAYIGSDIFGTVEQRYEFIMAWARNIISSYKEPIWQDVSGATR